MVIIVVLALIIGYLAAAYPTIVYQDKITLTLGYTEEKVPLDINWPKDQVQVSLEIRESLAIWNVTIYDSQNKPVWTHVGRAASPVIIMSGWKPARGGCVVVIRTLGRFDATVTIEVKGRPW